MRVGQLNQSVTLQRRSGAVDSTGQPLDVWVDVDDLWAGIGNETGLGAIRSSLASGVPASIARYSFLIRFDEIERLGIAADMRLVHDGAIFEIKGTVRDFKDREKAYILCEQGGSNG